MGAEKTVLLATVLLEMAYDTEQAAEALADATGAVRSLREDVALTKLRRVAERLREAAKEARP